VLAIEEQFGLSFEAEVIPALTSVRAIASAIEAHRAAAGA
jgi:acyl carrier protein